MKQGWTIQLFMAVTMTAAIATGCAQSADQQSNPSAELSPAAVSEGGEGGEGGEATGNADIDLMTNLGLMKGHLIVAKELIDQQQYQAAVPHIGHPVEEIYGDIETELTKRNLPQFKTQLNQTSDLIKSAPASPALQTAYQDSIAAIDQTLAAIPEAQRQSPAFIMPVIGGLLGTAADEYAAAIVDGKFVELVEYQDSRGFVIYAEELYKTIADAQARTDAAGHAKVQKAFTDLKAAWPAVNPPATPVKTPEEVAALVQMIVSQQVSMTHRH